MITVPEPRLTTSSRGAWIALVATVVGFFAPMLWRGEVISPHDNKIEVGLASDDVAGPQYRQYSDHSSANVPEMHHHLNGAKSGWLSVWNPHVQLGRPSFQLYGLSPAFLITRLLFLTSDDAYVVYTRLALATVVLMAVFGFLFLRAIGLHPWAAYAGGAGLALSIFSISRLTSVMFLEGLCWTLCLLWLVAKTIERPTIVRFLGIAFAAYSLLMTAYPQQVVWHAYLLVAFTLQRLLTSADSSARRWRSFTAIAGAVALGAVCAAPVYLDAALATGRSARFGVDPNFLMERMPRPEGWSGAARFVVDLYDASLVENPIESNEPHQIGRVSQTPLFFCLLLLLALGGGWRKALLWLGFIAAATLLVFWRAAYVFGIEHLGLHYSRFMPLAGVVIPFTVAAAMSLDRVLRRDLRRPVVALLVAAAPALLAPLAARALGLELTTSSVVASYAILAAVVALVAWRKPILVLPIVVACAAHYAWPALLSRPADEIAQSSPLVQRLREETANGTRYTIVGASPARLLPPNQESALGLRSIHSYDSLSTRNYQDLVLRFSDVGAKNLGRLFARIAGQGKLGGPELGFAGVSVLVSGQPLRSPAFAELGGVGGLHLYRSVSDVVMEAQLASFTRVDDGNVRIDGPLASQRSSPAERKESLDDLLIVKMSDLSEPSLLFVSQQFHPQWHASAHGEPLPTVLVNGFYQGVIVPPHTGEVRLAFRPYSRWSWIPHVFFVVSAGALAVRFLWRRKSVGDPPANPSVTAA